MTNTIASLFILAILATSCAVSKTKLSSDGEDVRILTKAEKDKCAVLDKVVGHNEKGSDELAMNHARNLAARADGNAVFFDDIVSNGNKTKVNATVYHCKK